MTGKRILRCMLMSAAFVLGVTGCPPEPPDDDDAGIGGSAPTGGTTGTGGRATGGISTAGTATGGRPVRVCDTVESLPAAGTRCDSAGESRCDAAGNQCVCERAVWHCNTNCASTSPTQPTPDSACADGIACNYASGASCECGRSRWVCADTSDCPADLPLTGNPCQATGVFCDYPTHDPHEVCLCTAAADASMSATWTCIVSAGCPVTQPSYPTTCAGTAVCRYGSTLCNCQQAGALWVCGLGLGILPAVAG